jgi:hypothetical protein
MHEPINVKSPNNTSKWQMGFNSAFKGLKLIAKIKHHAKKECVPMAVKFHAFLISSLDGS